MSTEKPEFDIRLATPSDVAWVAMITWQVLVETNRSSVYQFDHVLDGTRQVLETQDRGEYFIVQAGDHFAGQLKLNVSWNDLYNQAVAMIEHVYVHPRYRGIADTRGLRVYDHLHQHALQRCREKEAATIQLHVVSDNQRAQNAYVKRGMQATGFWMTQKLD